MENFLVSFGKWAFLAFPVVWIIVHLLAMPGTEISVFGIKYTKRQTARRKKKYKKVGRTQERLRSSPIMDWVLDFLLRYGWILFVIAYFDLIYFFVDSIKFYFLGKEFNFIGALFGVTLIIIGVRRVKQPS